MKVIAKRILAKSTTPAEVQTNIFAQINKVDVQNRLVYGRAVQEVPDASGEIFDYKSSKPYFEKWVDETKEASKGKSLGNIRSMHGNIAAGKAVEVQFHDDECAIDIAAKVVDDNEWEKVLEGVYTGFSIGGNYVGEKRKDGDLMRYTAVPIEISLVDKPCIPTAMFFDVVKSKGYTVVKVDGVEEHREFKLDVKKPDPVVKRVDDTPEDEGVEETITGTADEVKAFGSLMKASSLTLGKVVEMVKSQIKVDVPKRFADAANKKYPLDNNEQVLAAWYFINTAKAATLYAADELKALKTEILAAFNERFGKEPEEVTADKALGAMNATQLQKSFWGVASAASMMQQMAYFIEDMRCWEECGVIANAPVGKVVQCVKIMGEVISEMIASEATAIAAEAAAAGGDDGVMMAARAGDMSKAAAWLAKASGADMTDQDAKKLAKKIQKAHDMMVEMGALCAPADKAAPVAALLKALGADTTEDAAKLFKGLQDDVAKLKSEPRPSKAVLRVVAKVDDGGNLDDESDPVKKMIQDTQPVVDRDGKIDLAATAIKVMHRAGGRPALP